MSEARRARADALARSLAPEAWAALDGRDTKAHAVRREASTVMGAALDLFRSTRTVRLREASDVGFLVRFVVGCPDGAVPGRWVAPHLAALARLGLVERLSGPEWRGVQWRLTQAGADHEPAPPDAAEAPSP